MSEMSLKEKELYHTNPYGDVYIFINSGCLLGGRKTGDIAGVGALGPSRIFDRGIRSGKSVHNRKADTA